MNSNADLERWIPGLRSTQYEIQSPYDTKYNCIAWAARDTGNWWEPDPMGTCYWPAGAPREYTLAAYKAAFEVLGYRECGNHDLEIDFEKVVIFAKAGVPTHAARQRHSGRWTSKLGREVDIEHEIEAVVGLYGAVAVVLKRSSRGAGKS